MPRPTLPHVRRSTLVLVLTVSAMAFPLGALANHQFNDVPTAASYHDDVEALVNAGITTGCGGGNYCPNDPVKRGQMAQFLNRMGNLDGTSTPSVDADKVDGIDSSELVQHGDVAIQQLGPFFGNATADTAIQHFTDRTRIVAEGAGVEGPQLFLNAPAILSGRTYGIASVEICHLASTGGATIIDVWVQSSSSIPFPLPLIADSTDRSLAASGCFTVTDPTPNVLDGGATLFMWITFSDVGAADFWRVTTTWTPATAIWPAAAPESPSTNNGSAE